MTALAVIIAVALALGAVRRVPLYDAFVAGAKKGLKTAADILPALLTMMIALGALSGSGLTEALISFLRAPCAALGVPAEALPVMLVRPFSGSGALAALKEVFAAHGADSRAGLIASVAVGSSETVFYTCAVYLGAAGVRKSRHIVPAALISWLAGCAAACLLFPV